MDLVALLDSYSRYNIGNIVFCRHVWKTHCCRLNQLSYDTISYDVVLCPLFLCLLSDIVSDNEISRCRCLDDQQTRPPPWAMHGPVCRRLYKRLPLQSVRATDFLFLFIYVFLFFFVFFFLLLFFFLGGGDKR